MKPEKAYKPKVYGKAKKIKGESSAFVMHSFPLISSIAWQSQSINCRRLINFLEIEHLRHGGLENGYLKATYNQLQDFGIARCYISKAIKEAVYLGLIEHNVGMRKSITESYPNTFRLTYCKFKYYVETSKQYIYKAQTDEWRDFKK